MKKEVGLADRAGFLVIGNSAQMLSSMLAWVGLARLLSKAGFGAYRQAWLPYNLLFPVVTLGLPISMLYFLPRVEAGARKPFVRRTSIVLFCLGVLLAGGLWAAAPAIAAAFHNRALVLYIRVFAFYALLSHPIAHVQQVLVAHRRHAAAAWFTGLVAVVQSASALAAAWLTQAVEWALAAVVLSSVPAAAIGLALMELGPPADPAKVLPSLGDHLRYSVPVALSNLVLTFARQIGQVVVSVFYTATRFAVYAVGAFEVPVLGAFTGSIVTTLLPVFSDLSQREKWPELMAMWHESIRKLSLVIFPLFVMLLVLADQIVVVLFSRSYAESALIFRIFLLLLPMRITVYSTLLQATGRTRSLAVGAGGFLVANVVLGVALARMVGIAGPAAALVVSQYGLATYYLTQVCRVAKTGLRAIMPWGEVNRIFALAAAVGAAVFPFTRMHFNPVLVIAICVPIYLGLFWFGLRRLGLVRQTDLDLLRRWASLSVLTR